MTEKMAQVLIRPVMESEANDLLRIATATFIEAFAAQNSEDDLQCYLSEKISLMKVTIELTNPESKFYFVELNQQIVGYLKLNSGIAQTENMPVNAMEIERIYLLREYHGSGLAQRLLQEAVSVAEQMSCDFLWLGVWEENMRAIAFYQKQGFAAFGRHEFKLGQSIQTDILMKLAL